MKPDFKSLKSLTSNLNSLESGLKPLEYTSNPLIPEIRPKILAISEIQHEILISGEWSKK